VWFAYQVWRAYLLIAKNTRTYPGDGVATPASRGTAVPPNTGSPARKGKGRSEKGDDPGVYVAAEGGHHEYGIADGK
jgi:hypothetical protein